MKATVKYIGQSGYAKEDRFAEIELLRRTREKSEAFFMKAVGTMNATEIPMNQSSQ